MIGVPADRPPRLLEDLGVLQCCFNLQSINVDPPNPFDHVKILGVMVGLMPVTTASNGTQRIEADRIDHQRIALPVTDGVSHPADTRLMRPTVEGNGTKQMHCTR